MTGHFPQTVVNVVIMSVRFTWLPSSTRSHVTTDQGSICPNSSGGPSPPFPLFSLPLIFTLPSLFPSLTLPSLSPLPSPSPSLPFPSLPLEVGPLKSS